MLFHLMIIHIIIFGLYFNKGSEDLPGFLTDPNSPDYIMYVIRKEGKKQAERANKPVMSREKFQDYVDSKNIGPILARICPIASEGTRCDDSIDQKEQDPSLEWPKVVPGGSFGTIYMHHDDQRSTKVILANNFSKMVYALGEINLGRKFFESTKEREIANLVWTENCCSEMTKVEEGGKQTSAMKFYLRQPVPDYGNLRLFMVNLRNLPYLMDADWKIKILLGIKTGLYILHDGNYIHRDIKPENIFLLKRDVPLLSDFAFSVNYEREADVKLAGTPIYMPQEVLEKTHNISFSVDIYSFGIIMFEILNVNSYRITGDVITEITGYCDDEPSDHSSPSQIEKKLYCKHFHELVLQIIDTDPKKRPNIKQVSDFILHTGGKYIDEWNHELLNFTGCGDKPADLPEKFEQLITKYENQLWKKAHEELSEVDELDKKELTWEEAVLAYHCFYDTTKHYLIPSKIVVI